VVFQAFLDHFHAALQNMTLDFSQTVFKSFLVQSRIDFGEESRSLLMDLLVADLHHDLPESFHAD
jgi:hypothetical protein